MVKTISLDSVWAAIGYLADSGSVLLEDGAVDADGVKNYPQLSQNIEDNSVVALQKVLKQLGADLDEDGFFSTGTQEALLAYCQKPNYELERDFPKLMVMLTKQVIEHRIDLPSQGSETADEAQRLKIAAPDTSIEEDAAKQVKKAVDTALAASIIHYCQGDPRWATMVKEDGELVDRILGNKRTFAKSGCAVTCCAMLLDSVSKGIGTVDPGKMDDWLDENDGYEGDALKWGKVQEYGRQFVPTLRYDRKQGQHADLFKTACGLLESGEQPFLRVKYKVQQWPAPFNHFVLALAYDKGEIIFHDPGYMIGNGYEGDSDNSTATTRKGGYEIVGLDTFLMREQPRLA